MKLKISAKRIFFLFSSLAILLALLIIFYLIFNLPDKNLNERIISTNTSSILQNSTETAPSPISAETNNTEPTYRLVIPRIEVDAKIENVGLTADGSVDVPKDPANVAWYNLSPQPGEKGSSIITGHFGRWKDGKGSVFDNLNLLKRGDKLYTEDTDGTTMTFIVRDIKKYKPDEQAFDVFSADDNKAHLNLITCQGAWDKISKSFPDRLVIFADKK